MPRPKSGKWSQKYEKCVKCGKTKKPHKSRGLCTSCYSTYSVARRKEKRNEVKAEVYEIFSRPLEWTEERVEEEATALVEWASRDDSIVFEMFHCKRPKPYTRDIMYKLADKNVNFRSAFDLAKELIRGRREQGACVGAMNASSVQFYHGFYDRTNKNENMTFTAYKDERKQLDDSADVNKAKQAINESQAFVVEAKKRRKKKDEPSE